MERPSPGLGSNSFKPRWGSWLHPVAAALAKGAQPGLALAMAAQCDPFCPGGRSGPCGTLQAPRVAPCHLQGQGTPSGVWPWGEGDGHQARDRWTDGG